MYNVMGRATVGLCLEPLDVLFFRDGRPFTGSERSVSGLPLPQTLAGAIRTALLRQVGCDFARMKGAATFLDAVQRSCGPEGRWIGQVAIRGPWLARGGAQKGCIDVLVPTPAILHQAKRGTGKNDGPEPLHRLEPLPAVRLPGWAPFSDLGGLRPLWLKHLNPTEPAEGYLTSQGLTRFLRGEPVTTEDVVPSDALFGLDYRTGIGIAPDRLVAEESQIFGRGFLALKDKVFLYAEVELPRDAPGGVCLDQLATLPLGGEGRHVVLRHLPAPFTWPGVEPAGHRKPLVLLTTPCPFQAGWRPRGLDDHLVAAAVPDSVAFSGWDLARGGPKPARFAVPAGSVYFLESLPNNWAQTLAETGEERLQGWGCCLKGVWTDE